MGIYYLELHEEKRLDLGPTISDQQERQRSVELDDDDCFTEISGRIVSFTEADGEQEIGRVTAHLIDLHRAASPWETLDDRSQDLGGLAQHIYSEYAGTLCPSIARLYGHDTDILFDPVLYVEKIEVKVPHRGSGVGLMAMEALLDRFESRATLAFCKPCPMYGGSAKHEPENAEYIDLQLVKRARKLATAGLQQYWSRAGFRKVGRGPYFVVNIGNRDSHK